MHKDRELVNWLVVASLVANAGCEVIPFALPDKNVGAPSPQSEFDPNLTCEPLEQVQGQYGGGVFLGREAYDLANTQEIREQLLCQFAANSIQEESVRVELSNAGNVIVRFVGQDAAGDGLGLGEFIGFRAEGRGGAFEQEIEVVELIFYNANRFKPESITANEIVVDMPSTIMLPNDTIATSIQSMQATIDRHTGAISFGEGYDFDNRQFQNLSFIMSSYYKDVKARDEGLQAFGAMVVPANPEFSAVVGNLNGEENILYSNTQEIQDASIAKGVRLLVSTNPNGEGNLLGASNGRYYINYPTELYDPLSPETSFSDLLLRTDNNWAYYKSGTKVATSVPLTPGIYYAAVILAEPEIFPDQDLNFGAGTLLIQIMDKETGAIIGYAPGAFEDIEEVEYIVEGDTFLTKVNQEVIHSVKIGLHEPTPVPVVEEEKTVEEAVTYSGMVTPEQFAYIQMMVKANRDTLRDYGEQLNAVGTNGYIVSYELTRNGSSVDLYVNFVTDLGVVTVRPSYVVFPFHATAVILGLDNISDTRVDQIVEKLKIAIASVQDFDNRDAIYLTQGVFNNSEDAVYCAKFVDTDTRLPVCSFDSNFPGLDGPLGVARVKAAFRPADDYATAQTILKDEALESIPNGPVNLALPNK